MKGNKIVIQFTAVSFILILTIFYGYLFIRKTSNLLINTHITFFQDSIQKSLNENPGLYTFFTSDNQKEYKDAANILTNMLYKRGVNDVRFWNTKNKVIWPGFNEPDNIQSGNNSYLNAIKGEADYKLFKTGNEAGSPAWILDAFIPVKYEDNVIGAVEIRQNVNELNDSVNEMKQKLIFVVIVFAIVLYFLLFFIFFQVNRNQKRILNKLEQTQNGIIFALAYQAELHDHETGEHLERVSSYVKIIVHELSKNEKYKEYLTEEYINDLVRASHLHDIGKVGIPDTILKKPGKVTSEEFEIIKNHCEYGVKVLRNALSKLSIQSFLDIALQLVACHHEKWDGTGYPYGLVREQIPLSGRIMALADVYDALRSDRVYKKSIEHEECINIIAGLSGSHFDPEIVQIFMLYEQEFFRISESV